MEKIAADATCRLGLASVFRLAVPVAPGYAPQYFDLTASGGRLPTERTSPPTPADRSPVLVVAFAGMVGLARCLTVCLTGYSDCLAEAVVLRPLATAEPTGEARSPSHCQGDQGTDSARVTSESDVGRTTDRRRAAEAGHQRRQIDGREVPSAAEETTITHVEDIPQHPC